MGSRTTVGAALVGPYGNSAGFGYKPPRPKPARPNANGGLTFNPNASPTKQSSSSFSAGGFVQPPPGTYDPAIEAQRQAGIRGEHDILRQSHHEIREGNQDLAQALRNVKTKTGRSRQDTNIAYRENEQKLAYGRADTEQRAARSLEDFHARLADIGRRFAELGHQQSEGRNAAGVNDAGTTAASNAARGRNQGIAEAPIHTGEARLGEDLATALRRNEVAGGELGESRGRSLTRLNQDRDRERRLGKQDWHREQAKIGEKDEIAKREAQFSNLNSLESEVYNARQTHPAAFTKAGKKKK